MKKKPLIVDIEKMETLEQYAASLLYGIVSLRTLEEYQTRAFKLGLYDEDEEETSKTIIWEIQRLLALYQAQMGHILERTSLSQDEILREFGAKYGTKKAKK